MDREEAQLRLDVNVDRAGRIVQLAGELDVFTAQLLTDEVCPLIDLGEGHVDIDMAAVGFCDSSGLNSILKLRRSFADAGVALRIVRPSRVVARLLALTGLGQLVAEQRDHV